jgi:hypothetical protein
MNSQGLGQNGNKKNKVVIKLKRKRENVPEETIVVEERAKKAAKLNFIDSFSKMGFEDKQAKSKTLFRFLGSESETNTFDFCARLKEVRILESEKLPTIYPKKQGVVFEEKKKKESKNTMPGLITKTEKTEGYEIIEINHSSLMIDDAIEYDYYYIDEVTNLERVSGEVLTIQFESFFVNDEVDEYDQDDPLSGDEEEIDYPSSDSEGAGSINSWERGSSDDDDWDGAGPHNDSSEDEYGDEYDY